MFGFEDAAMMHYTGTFANIRFKNIMADGKEGGYTKLMPEGTPIDIYDVSQIYRERNTGLIIFAGKIMAWVVLEIGPLKGSNLLELSRCGKKL